MILNNDTIIAQATPQGKSGIGIIRISGNKSSNIAKILLGTIPKPRYANYMNFLDENKNIIDRGIAIWFPKPNSFTGEDVLELQGHGSQVIINIIIKNIIKIPGVRVAHPGEFSERAFLNNKIDLIQAEAIIDLINASSEQGARSAMYSLQGYFSKLINNLLESIINIRTFIETSIDFVEEDLDLMTKKKFKDELQSILKTIDLTIKESKKIRNLYEGMRVVIIGDTNVGKSSLMNILTGKTISIVTDIAGTTRDILREFIDIKERNNSISIKISDTAGLRDTSDLIELMGIKLAYEEVKFADHVLYVLDHTKVNNNSEIDKNLDKILSNKKIDTTLVYNKIDLTKKKPKIEKTQKYTRIFISSYTGEGIDLLTRHLINKFYLNNQSIPDNNQFLARHRHLQALIKVKKHVTQSIMYISDKNIQNELLAEELRLAQQSLGSITGKFTSDDLLKNIFSKFCIGK